MKTFEDLHKEAVDEINDEFRNHNVKWPYRNGSKKEANWLQIINQAVEIRIQTKILYEQIRIAPRRDDRRTK